MACRNHTTAHVLSIPRRNCGQYTCTSKRYFEVLDSRVSGQILVQNLEQCLPLDDRQRVPMFWHWIDHQRQCSEWVFSCAHTKGAVVHKAAQGRRNDSRRCASRGCWAENWQQGEVIIIYLCDLCDKKRKKKKSFTWNVLIRMCPVNEQLERVLTTCCCVARNKWKPAHHFFPILTILRKGGPWAVIGVAVGIKPKTCLKSADRFLSIHCASHSRIRLWLKNCSVLAACKNHVELRIRYAKGFNHASSSPNGPFLFDVLLSYGRTRISTRKEENGPHCSKSWLLSGLFFYGIRFCSTSRSRVSLFRDFIGGYMRSLRKAATDIYSLLLHFTKHTKALVVRFQGAVTLIKIWQSCRKFLQHSTQSKSSG